MREAGSLPQDDGVIRIVGRVLRRQRTEGGALFPALEDKVDTEPLASFHAEAVGPNVNLRSCVDNKIMNPTAGGNQHLHDFPPGPWLPTPSLHSDRSLLRSRSSNHLIKLSQRALKLSLKTRIRRHETVHNVLRPFKILLLPLEIPIRRRA